MPEKATVVEISGDVAKVELQPNVGCKSCGLCTRSDKGTMVVEVDALPGLERGQSVLLEGGQTSWAGSLLLFVLPMVSLLAGVVIGQSVNIGLPPDVASAIFGVVLLAASFTAGYAWERRLKARKKADRPRIVLAYPGPDSQE